MQQFTDRKPDRTLHVWRRAKGGGWKCILCGGLTEAPTDTAACAKYERLDETDRRLCQNLVR